MMVMSKNELGTDFADFTDKNLTLLTKNRVYPCNPCLKKISGCVFSTHPQ